MMNVQTYDDCIEALRVFLGNVDTKYVEKVTISHISGSDEYIVTIKDAPSRREVVERRITRE